jgi:hypothetical protein
MPGWGLQNNSLNLKEKQYEQEIYPGDRPWNYK